MANLNRDSPLEEDKNTQLLSTILEVKYD